MGSRLRTVVSFFKKRTPGRFLVVMSRVSSRRLVCGVSKTSFYSSAVVFGSFFHQTCFVLSSFVASVCVMGSFEKKNCRRLKTSKNQSTKRSLSKPVRFRRVGSSVEGNTHACLCMEAVYTIFMMVFGMTRPGCEPASYRIRGGYVNH